MIIYKATNKINKKLYIGCTTNTLEYRKNQHLRDSRCKTRENTAFTQAVLEYGIDSFEFIVIDEALTMEEMFEKEEYYIKKYKSLIHENGYNLTTGGKSGKRFKRTKEKMKKHTKNVWNDPIAAEKMKEGLKKGSEAHVKNCKEKLVPMKCETCGKIVMLPKWEFEKRKYCSPKCVPFNMDGLELAKKTNIELKINRHAEIKSLCLEWAKHNLDVITNAKFNNIENVLNPMIDFIYTNCGIKDYRTIGMAVCENPSRKELLKSLKEYVKIYAEPDWN